jgi:hypothetical protein
MSFPVAILTLLAAAAAAAAVVFLGRKVRRHRRLLDRRIDILAEESFERGHSLDLRLDEMTRAHLPLQRLHRVDHLLVLAGVAERSGRLGANAARRLERSLLDLYDDALAEDAGSGGESVKGNG